MPFGAWPTTQIRKKVVRFPVANSHRLPRISTLRTPFSSNLKQKRKKGCHFAKAAKRHRTQTTKPRQKPQAPPAPATPHSAAPSGRRGGRVGRDRRVNPVSLKHSEKRDRRGRGLESSKFPARGPRARPARDVWRKWGVRGGGRVWRDFVVCLPASRALLRAAGWHRLLQGERAHFLAGQ